MSAADSPTILALLAPLGLANTEELEGFRDADDQVIATTTAAMLMALYEIDSAERSLAGYVRKATDQVARMADGLATGALPDPGWLSSAADGYAKDYARIAASAARFNAMAVVWLLATGRKRVSTGNTN